MCSGGGADAGIIRIILEGVSSGKGTSLASAELVVQAQLAPQQT